MFGVDTLTVALEGTAPISTFKTEISSREKRERVRWLRHCPPGYQSLLRSAPRQYMRSRCAVRIVFARRSVPRLPLTVDSRLTSRQPLALPPRRSLLRTGELGGSEDHASGRRTQQPAQQTAEDQRRARGGQGGEEAVQIRERLHGVPWAVAPRDQAVRADLQQVSIFSLFALSPRTRARRYWNISVTVDRSRWRLSPPAFEFRFSSPQSGIERDCQIKRIVG